MGLHAFVCRRTYLNTCSYIYLLCRCKAFKAIMTGKMCLRFHSSFQIKIVEIIFIKSSRCKTNYNNYTKIQKLQNLYYLILERVVFLFFIITVEPR
jgi:hypothetical protein